MLRHMGILRQHAPSARGSAGFGAGRGQFARVASQFASPNIEFCAVAEEFPWIFRDFAARVHELSPVNCDFRHDAQSFVASARPFITKEPEMASRGALS